jgi:glycosyltransferase involved in cell wall biosynthesis
MSPSSDVAALPPVLAHHPSARCLIAGEGDKRPALQLQIAALHLDRPATLRGFRRDIPALLQACDLFVLPSAAEPFGLVLLEAMALAEPVIATRAAWPARCWPSTSGA